VYLYEIILDFASKLIVRTNAAVYGGLPKKSVDVGVSECVMVHAACGGLLWKNVWVTEWNRSET